jgi:MFS transporter, PAT family, beta-lactamase induction signal transducer AmpG
MTATTTAAAPKKKRTMMDVIRALRQRKMAVMLALGFSSGLPFMMFGNTLGFWLAEGNVKLATIGFLSWTGLVFLIKFVWGAVVDRMPVPLPGNLGRRRGWMIFTQLMVAAGLVGMAVSGPQHIPALAVFAVLTALGGAMQDTVIDAWRIEIADSPDELGLLTAAYTLGYRIALFASEALILIIATAIGWPVSYAIFGGLMAVGMVAAWLGGEPARTLERPTVAAKGPAMFLRNIWDAVAGPIIVFFKAHGVAVALLTLLTITLYHLCDYMRGPLSGPYYLTLGIDKPTIAGVRAAIGIPMTLVGVTLGGIASIRIGATATLLIGAVLQPIGVAAFAILAAHGGDFTVFQLGAAPITAFELIMGFDALSIGFSGLALITFMSSLTSIGYTATQYALLTSAMAWSGKFLKGFSGEIVENLQAAGNSKLEAYRLFYLGSAAIGIPAIICCVIMVWRTQRLLRRARANARAAAEPA